MKGGDIAMLTSDKLLKISGRFPATKLILERLMQVYGKEAKLLDVLKRINKA